jgi:hypothetical protein
MDVLREKALGGCPRHVVVQRLRETVPLVVEHEVLDGQMAARSAETI